MKKMVAYTACGLIALGTSMNAIHHARHIPTHIQQNSMDADIGGSKFWAGLACGGSIGAAVFLAPTLVGTGAAIVIAAGTCGDAFFG